MTEHIIEKFIFEVAGKADLYWWRDPCDRVSVLPGVSTLIGARAVATCFPFGRIFSFSFQTEIFDVFHMQTAGIEKKKFYVHRFSLHPKGQFLCPEESAFGTSPELDEYSPKPNIYFFKIHFNTNSLISSTLKSPK
jgi:hypothetical protein